MATILNTAQAVMHAEKLAENISTACNPLLKGIHENGADAKHIIHFIKPCGKTACSGTCKHKLMHTNA